MFQNLLINCEINLILTWSANYSITDASIDNQVPTFTINDTTLYVLQTQDNAKLLQEL